MSQGLGKPAATCIVDRNACQKAGAATEVIADYIFPPGSAFILATLGPGFDFAVVDDPTHAAWTATCELLDASMVSQGPTVVAVGASNATLPWVPESIGGGSVTLGQDISGYTLRLTVAALGLTVATGSGVDVTNPMTGLDGMSIAVAIVGGDAFSVNFSGLDVDVVATFAATMGGPPPGTDMLSTHVTAAIVSSNLVLTGAAGVSFTLADNVSGSLAALGLTAGTYTGIADVAVNTITGAPRVVLSAAAIGLST